MTVYTVEKFAYEEAWIVGVYATEESAKAACRQPLGDPIEHWVHVKEPRGRWLESNRRNEHDYDIRFRVTAWEVAS